MTRSGPYWDRIEKIAVDVHFGDPKMERFAPALAASIDAGKPVVAYDDRWDMAVIYGYAERGKKLLFRDYFSKDGSRELPISKIVGMWFTLEEHREAPPRREAVIGALRMAADQWKRVSGKAGPGEYWYGEAAWERWLGDLRRADSVTKAQRDKMLDVSRWVYLTLTDARKAAVAFFKESVASLPEPARDAARRAQETYGIGRVRSVRARSSSSRKSAGSMPPRLNRLGRR